MKRFRSFIETLKPPVNQKVNATKAFSKLRLAIQQGGNSLNIYCRLCQYLPCKTARKIAKAYENKLQKIVYML